MNTTGFEHVHDLRTITVTDLQQVVKQARSNGGTFPLLAEKRILALHYTTLDDERWGARTVCEAITKSGNDAYIKLVNDHNSVKNEANEDISLPEKFVEGKQWRRFDSQLKEYLKHKYGKQCIPLVYLIRENEDPVNDDSIDFEENRIYSVPLDGDSFFKENAKLYSWLKQLMINGPGWTHIQPFDRNKDGRGAYKRLCDHYLSGDHKQTIVQEAESVLERISYAGDRKNFTFDKFIAKFISAYNDIDDYGPQKPAKVPDETKVTKLLNKITDPVLAATKTVILSQPYYYQNFENAKSLFLTQLSSVKNTTQANRAVSCVTTDHGGRGRGGRNNRNNNSNQGRGRSCYGRNSGRAYGRGRGYTYSRGYGRGYGRGRGRGRGGRGYSPRQQYNQFNYYNEPHIPDDVWYSMTPTQRYNVHVQRKLEGTAAANKVSGLITDGTTSDQKPENILVPYNPAASNASVVSDSKSATSNPADQFGQRKSP